MKGRKRPGASSEGGGGGAPAGIEPGKRTRTQSLAAAPAAPAVGPSTSRLNANPSWARFKPTEIGKTRHDDIKLTNVSAEPFDFFAFLETVLPSSDGFVRPTDDGGDFAVVGGATTSDGLLPGESTSIMVEFAPKASHPDDLKKHKQSKRETRFAILDPEGAIGDTFTLAGFARPPSADTIDEGEVAEIKSAARRSGSRLPPPKSFDEMRHHLMAARDLMQTSERDDADELVGEVSARMYEALRYDQVLHAFRSYGFGTQSATMMVGHAHDQVVGASTRLSGGLAVNMDYVLTSFEVAKEPMQLVLGEVKKAPTIQAMHDAAPVVMAGRAAEEVGETAKQIVTDAAFAAGFGVGVLEGTGGAVKDLATGAVDVLELAFDIAKAMVTGGIIGATLEAAEKLNDFFQKAPAALAGMGEDFRDNWNAPGSFSRGNFRGEVTGYVAAQIAIIVISGGAAAEGVAFASLSRWGKVAAIIQKADAAGDILGWAAAAGRRVPLPRKLIDKIDGARAKAKKAELQDSPSADARPRSSSDGAPETHGTSKAESVTSQREPGAWETGTEPGLPATAETIAHGSCAMEVHPDFTNLIDEARNKGFRIVYDAKAHVANIRVVNEAGELIEMRRELHLIAGARFLDLEHELGHIRQLERFGDNPPATETILRRADGTEGEAKNELRRGSFDKGEDSLIEYHNRLDEYVRLAERGLPSEVLRAHAEHLVKWRTRAERAGLGQGGGRGSFHRWAKEHFPEIPTLERRVRALGADIGRTNVRWEDAP